MNNTFIKDIAPSKTNTRNSEGAFITLKNGDILFVYSRFGGDSWHDHAPSDLYGVISKDAGLTFSEPFLVLSVNDVPEAANLMSVSLIRLLNGDIGMFFLRKSLHPTMQGLYTGTPCLIRSSDEGNTWHDLQVIETDELYVTLNNDRVIRLNDNSLFFVVGAVPTVKSKNGEGYEKYTYLKSYPVAYISKDDGKTWQKQGAIEQIYTFVSGLQEPGAIQKQDGSIYCFIRCDIGFQLESVSTDQGKTWTIPHQSRFTSPTSPMSQKRLSNGNIMAVWNPYPIHINQDLEPGGMHMGGRSPIVYAISDDDGKTWSKYKVLDDDKTAGYCYTAIHEIDDAILVAYCAGGPQDGNFLSRLRIRRILKTEL